MTNKDPGKLHSCSAWKAFAGGRECGNPAKDQDDRGQWLCRRHMAGWRRRQANQTANKVAYEENQKLKAETELLRDQLAEYGIDASLQYSGKAGYTGKVIVDSVEVLRALEKAND